MGPVIIPHVSDKKKTNIDGDQERPPQNCRNFTPPSCSYQSHPKPHNFVVKQWKKHWKVTIEGATRGKVRPKRRRSCRRRWCNSHLAFCTNMFYFFLVVFLIFQFSGQFVLLILNCFASGFLLVSGTPPTSDAAPFHPTAPKACDSGRRLIQ